MADSKDDVAKTLGLGSTRAFRPSWIKYAVLAALVGAGVVYWLLFAGSERNVNYATEAVSRGGFSVVVNATGTVEPTNLVEISSELSGTLEDVNVDFNDRVEVGTVLATLDTTQLEAQLRVSKASVESAAARIEMAQAKLEDAREKFEAAESLGERGILARQAFITQKTALATAEAELTSAVAEHELAEAKLALQQAILDKACICSPIRGIVLSRSADPGQIVASTLAAPILFTVAEDLTKMELQVDIDEADIGRIAVGQSAEFTVDAYDDRRFPAEIAEIRFAPETVEGVVTYKAILAIDNSELLLRPGMTANADITVAEIADALIVPNAALRYAPPREDADKERSGLLGMIIPDAPPVPPPPGAEQTLWVMRDDRPVEVGVKTGDSDGRMTEIAPGEVAEGDLVVTGRNDG